MEKLSDEEIRNIIADDGEKYWTAEKRMAIELRDLRAQRAASRERVMEVVREASIGVLAPIGVRAAHIPAEDIAARVADALAAPQPAIDAALVLEVVERAVADWLAMNCAPSSTMADVQVASAVMGKGIAARVAEQLAGQEVTLSAEDRKALRELREELRESMDADHPGLAAFDHLLATPGQGASLAAGDSVEPHTGPAENLTWCSRDEHGHECVPPCPAAPSDAPDYVSTIKDSHGRTVRVMQWDAEVPAQPQPGPTASSVDPALCRRLAALAMGPSLRVLPITTPEREDIARQLTAAAELADNYRALQHRLEHTCKLAGLWTGSAGESCQTCGGNLYDHVGSDLRCPNRSSPADLREAFDALQVVAKDAQDQLRAERDRARAAASDAHEDWKGMQAERDAARRELARLAEAFEEATGKLAVAVTAKENAEHDLDAARRELAELKERNAALRHAVDDAVATLGKVETERDAARAECELLRAALDKRPLRTFDQLAADRLADEVAVLVRRKVIDARSPAGDALLDYRDPPPSPRADRMATLEAEFVALRRALWARLEERQAMTSRIYDLLATEPAVSEVGVSEIEQEFRPKSEDDSADARYLIAGYRQLHALRAGLREIVGGEPAPRAWAVTPERVDALRWVVGLSGATAAEWAMRRDEAAVRLLSAMLSEVSP